MLNFFIDTHRITFMENTSSSNKDDNMNFEQTPSDSVNGGGNSSKETISNDDLWGNVGFHRPLAGFFYNLIFMLFTMVFGIFVGGYLTKLMYPFPESAGYKSAATALFGLFFQIMDLGTANMVNRYLGENSIKNPKKMVQYIQYFIWYQSMTGLIQTTTVSLYALYFVPRTELAYAIWIMLIQSTTQFPGYLWIFKDILGSLQQFHKTTVLNFLTGNIIQQITEIAFVLAFRAYGEAHPEVGVILAIAWGSMIGTYVDDFISTLICAKMFQTTMKQYGIRVRDCFGHDFDFAMFKDAILFGIKTGVPGLLWSAITLVSLWFWVSEVPQYTTFVALANFAGTFSGLVGTSLDLGGSISESFMNGKKKLAQYFIGQSCRFVGFIQALIISILAVVILILEPVLEFLGLSYYILSIAFIVPKIVREIQQPYNNISESVITQSNNPNINFWMHIIEDVFVLLGWVLWFWVLQLPQKYGFIAIVWLIPCGELPAIVIKVICNFYFINKKIVRVKIPVWQTWVAPLFSASIISGIAYLIYLSVFVPLFANYGMIPALISMIILGVIVLPLFVYGPLTVFFGSWDTFSMDTMRRAVKISGPSKILTIPMFKLLEWTVKISPFHNRFAQDATEATQEARELMEMKNSFLAKKVATI